MRRGRGGAGRGGVGWGGVVTYFADRTVPQYKTSSLAPEIQCLSVDFFTAVLSNCTHFTAEYTQKTYVTLIYVQKM